MPPPIIGAHSKLLRKMITMTKAKLLDGKATANEIRSEIREKVEEFVAASGTRPRLVAILVGEDPASQVYVRNKERACEKAGIDSEVIRLPSETTTEQLMETIGRWNDDKSTHGILVQLPLPPQIDTQRVLDSVAVEKDVDAFSPENVGLVSQGRPRFLPCTPHGVAQILMRYNIELAGKHVVVVGRSDIVGKPLASMLVQREGVGGPKFANATVTCCHSQSRDLQSICLQADVLIVAVGKPQLVGQEMVKPGAVVIDVGINRVADRLVGDVDFEQVEKVASAITPVPGGVGPLTIAMLLHNTLLAAIQQGAKE